MEKSWRPKLTQDSAVSTLASGDCEVEEEEEEEHEIKQKWIFFWECKRFVLYESHGLVLDFEFVRLNNWWCGVKAATAMERYGDTQISSLRLPLSIYPNSFRSGAPLYCSWNLGRVYVRLLVRRGGSDLVLINGIKFHVVSQQHCIIVVSDVFVFRGQALNRTSRCSTRCVMCMLCYNYLILQYQALSRSGADLL